MSSGPHVALTVEQLWQPVPGGSGTYIRELVRALRAEGSVRVTGVRARHGDAAPGDDLGVPVVGSRLPRRVLYDGWNHLRRPHVPVPDADVVHATTWAVPPRSRPLVVTVHDVAFLHAPEHFTPRGNRYFRRALGVVRAEADAVVVPSQTTADDCAAQGIEPERLHVIPHGVRVPNLPPGVAAAIRRHHGLDRPYVLWCGTLEPRKNLGGLLRAFALLAPDEPDLDLVVVGPSGWGDAAQDLRDRAGAPPLAGRVRMLGHVATDDLHALYAGARAFCFPSHREGFGMPVLEAMAHGVPVVTSAGTSMAEFSEGAALLVDPHDDAALAEALRSAVTDEHDRLAASAAARAAEHTWAVAARRTAEVYAAVR